MRTIEADRKNAAADPFSALVRNRHLSVSPWRSGAVAGNGRRAGGGVVDGLFAYSLRTEISTESLGFIDANYTYIIIRSQTDSQAVTEPDFMRIKIFTCSIQCIN